MGVAAPKPLRRSRFVHLLPLSDNRVLVIHALTHLRVAPLSFWFFWVRPS